MDFKITEGEGTYPYGVTWESYTGFTRKLWFDYWHEAVDQYYHLKGMKIETTLFIRAMPMSKQKDITEDE